MSAETSGSEAHSRAVDFIPMAVGGMIVVHQGLRQAVADDLKVQIVEIPIVIHEKRVSLLFDLKGVVTLVHED
jgi:hypothetical protein